MKIYSKRFFSVGLFLTFYLIVMFIWSQYCTVFAYNEQVIFNTNVVGQQLVLEGNDTVENIEVQLKVEDTIYTSNTRDYDHIFTITLDNATFNATTEEEFLGLIYLGTEDPLVVTINEMRSDEFTFTISNGIFKKDDLFAVFLKSTLDNSKVGTIASFTIESNVFEEELEFDFATVVAGGFYASLDEKLILVPEEYATLAGDGVKISPDVAGSYVAGTEFTLSISRGFSLLEKADIKAKTKAGAVTEGKVVNGNIIVTAPSADAFSITGIVIEATTAKVGDVAEIKIEVADQIVYLSASNASNEVQSSTDAVPAVKEEEVEEEEVTETEDETTVEVATLPIVEIAIGASAMAVDGVLVELDVPAYISNGYTLLPLRAVAELMDNATVDWEADTQTAVVNIGNGERVVRMSIGATNYSVNGEQVVYTGATAEITDGRTFVPIRDLAYALGSDDVEWDSLNRVVTLNGSM